MPGKKSLAVRHHSYTEGSTVPTELRSSGPGALCERLCGFLLSYITSPENWCSETNYLAQSICEQDQEHGVDCGATGCVYNNNSQMRRVPLI